MRILITGGAGFIGSHLAEHWCGQGASVVVLDNLRTGKTANLEGMPVKLVQADIREKAEVRRSMEGVDLVFHLAAMVSVPESVERPEACVLDNVVGTLNVLEAAVETGARVVFASSAAVYGDNPEVPKVETMLPEPKSPYAITKLDGEYYLESYRLQHGLSCAGLRFFNVFGPGQNPSGPYASAVPVFIDRALRNETLTIFGDGTQTRDFIFVKDIVSALSFLGLRREIHGIHNAGYGLSTRIDTLAERVISLTGSSSAVRHESERAGDVKHSYACADQLMGLGWRPEWDFPTALEATVEAFKKRYSR
ncbi:MAG: NAD-dependent epimerase/dehydratase family protein [Oceanipulchritudo sp.]